ncbi:MAG: putative motility protein [Firmicutes bacterium]|nr:putative motility protein [Bacillota bacterium]
MDVGKTSLLLDQMKIKQQASISVMKKAMNNSKQANTFINDMMKTNTETLKSLDPKLGNTIDIKA